MEVIEALRTSILEPRGVPMTRTRSRLMARSWMLISPETVSAHNKLICVAPLR